MLCILDEVKPNKALLTNVAAKMKDQGYSYSYNAIKYSHLFFKHYIGFSKDISLTYLYS